MFFLFFMICSTNVRVFVLPTIQHNDVPACLLGHGPHLGHPPDLADICQVRPPLEMCPTMTWQTSAGLGEYTKWVLGPRTFGKPFFYEFH